MIYRGARRIIHKVLLAPLYPPLMSGKMAILSPF